MPTTVENILNDTKALVDDEDITLPQVEGWVNEALADLAEVLRLERLTSIPIQKGKTKYVTADGVPTKEQLYLPVCARVNDELEPLFPVSIGAFGERGFYFWNGDLYLQEVDEDGTLTLWWFAWPTAVSGASAEPETPKHFRHLHALYGAGRHEQIGEEIDDKNDFMQDYRIGRALLDVIRDRQVTPFLPKQTAPRPAPWT